ncbi:MAG: helix-turn-helix domain-containing protein [Streptosporangiaceae bacterium]
MVLPTDMPALPPRAEPGQVLDLGLDVLRHLLPDEWTVQERPTGTGPAAGLDEEGDTLIDINSPQAGGNMVLIAARTSVTPADAQRVLGPKMSLLQRIYAGSEAIVMAPWLSRKSREVLEQRRVGYLDLTGNINIKLSRPAVVIRTQGRQQDPTRTGQPWQRGLSGVKAARLVRVLADASPPYRATDLAEAAGVSQPYASRLLEVMEQQALIIRDGRAIGHVDWEGLLRARAASYSLLSANPSVTMIAPNGIEHVLRRLRELDGQVPPKTAVTGAVAADFVAPLTVGEQLMLYVPGRIHAPDEVADALGLLRSDRGDVVLMRASDDIVFAGRRRVRGIWNVALSQLVIDCLAGPGRLPAAAEPVLEYMHTHEPDWRAPSLRTLPWHRRRDAGYEEA